MKIEDKDVDDFLAELKTPGTRRIYEFGLSFFARYLDGQGKTLGDFKAMTTKERMHMALTFQNSHPKGEPRAYPSTRRKNPIVREARELSNNSINSVLTAVQSFCSFLDPDRPLPLKGKRIPLEEDVHGYDFLRGDLGKLYDSQDVRGKAIIACASSCGLDVSSFLALDRRRIEQELKILEGKTAQDPNTPQCVFYDTIRGKTKVKGLIVLNPLAVQSLREWLPLNPGDALFDITKSGMPKWLKSAVRKANLTVTGNVKFHKFRSWVMTNLIRAGFSDFEAKIVVHKKIPMGDSTYLKLKDGIVEKYPMVYEQYLNVKANGNGNGKVKQILVDQAKELAEMREIIAILVQRTGTTQTTTKSNVPAAEIDSTAAMLKRLKDEG